MGNAFIVLFALFQLLLQLLPALGGPRHFTGDLAIVDDVLHPGDLVIVDTLHSVQVINTQVANGVLVIAVHIDKRLEAVLLTAVKEPVNRTLAGTGNGISLAMILEEVIQEVIANDLPAGIALARQCFGNKVQIVLQRVLAVDLFQPCTEQPYNIIREVFFIGDGENVILVWNKAAVFVVIPLSTRKGKAIHIQRTAAKHTAHGAGNQAADVTVKVCLADGHILVPHLGRQLVLQAVDVDKNAVQLFFVGFELVEPVIAGGFPISICRLDSVTPFCRAFIITAK